VGSKTKERMLLFYVRLGYRVALNFCGSLILWMAIFCALRELIFVIGKNWFFYLGTKIFNDFWNYNILVFRDNLSTNNRMQVNNMLMYNTLII